MTRLIVPAQAEIAPFLPPRIAAALCAVSPACWRRVEEIRLRTGRPVILGLDTGEAYLGPGEGGLAPDPQHALLLTPDEARQTMDLAAQGSVYALQEQLSAGYLTLPGGHRLGLCGRAVVDFGQLRGMRHVGSFCLRLAREVRGAASAVLPWMLDGRGPAGRHVLNTLFVSPPRCGKTTVLRDAVRQLSCGVAELDLPPQRVSLVDERSEVAGSWQGVPCRDVGPRTDVLDSCPKALGMVLMLRSAAPDVIATDEIGREDDVDAIEEAANCGVAVLATAHAWDLDDLSARPTTARLVRRSDFQRLVFLGRSNGPGTVETILDGRSLRPLSDGVPAERPGREP